MLFKDESFESDEPGKFFDFFNSIVSDPSFTSTSTAFWKVNLASSVTFLNSAEILPISRANWYNLFGPKIKYATTPITKTSELPTPKNPPEGPNNAVVFKNLDFEY